MRNLKVPQHLMSQVLGKGRENLRNIEINTGAALRVINDSFYIQTATERQEKLAEREIKTLAVRVSRRDDLVLKLRDFPHGKLST